MAKENEKQKPQKQQRKRVPVLADGNDTDAVFELLEKESDRGGILVLGAWLDELLGELLRKVLGAHKATLEKLFDGPGAPLGTFSARINMAHALGYLAEDEWKALNKIRDIRNTAAHFEHTRKARGFILGFSDKTLANQVKEIDILHERIITLTAEQENPARWLFHIAGAVLVGRLMARITVTQSLKPRATTNWDDYWADFIKKNADPPAESDEDLASDQAKFDAMVKAPQEGEPTPDKEPEVNEPAKPSS